MIIMPFLMCRDSNGTSEKHHEVNHNPTTINGANSYYICKVHNYDNKTT